MTVRIAVKSLVVAISAATLFTACNDSTDTKTEATTDQTPATTIEPKAVAKHYAELAHATYSDALTTAKALDTAADDLIANPTDETLTAAKEAWLAARVPYQQSEVFRFGNAVVDNWEGQLNAWPLDEGLIDYVVDDDYQFELGNEGATANIIGSNKINVGGKAVDVSTITPKLLSDLNEIGGSEANVATGYHAVEFLLWGQDLNGFEPGNGNRPATDYAPSDDCTNNNCDRRAAYLDAVTDLLVTDLQWMVAQWAPGNESNYRSELLAQAPNEVFQKMLFGMGSLSLGELAGERMKVALEANSFEDEQDCFSDNTHNSHYYNGQGIMNVYTGKYTRVDGSILQGPSLSQMVATQNPDLNTTLTQQLEKSMSALGEIKNTAEAGGNSMVFDRMIAPGNTEGATLINEAISTLVAQTGSIETAAQVIGIDSLESDDAGHAF